MMMNDLSFTRVCPGKYLAENAIFVIISNMLALFNLSAPSEKEPPGSDEADLKHPSEVEFGPYLVRWVHSISSRCPALRVSDKFESINYSCPEKFRCNIVPRSKACADLIEQAHAAGGK